MKLLFPHEELIIKGKSVMGNLVVEANATDASFSHEFGTEAAVEVEFTWDYFQHISGWLPGDIDYMKPALDRWLTDNQDKLQKAFDNVK